MTIAAVLASLTQVILLMDEVALETLLFWLSGGFADRGLTLLAIGVPCRAAGAIGTLLVASALDALRADDDSARAVGVAVGRTRVATLALAAVLAGGAAAMAGPAAFVGLVAPHIARRLPVGRAADHAALALLAALVGAGVALLADIAARVIVAPGEAPISDVLSLVGVPVLIGLLRRERTVAA